jgi:hypothetical protein
MTPILHRCGAALSLALLGGCSFLHDTFSQTVDPSTSARIHKAVPVGTTMVAAEAQLSSLDFDCVNRTGDFTDENGSARNAPSFLSCTQRAGKISFSCENRNQVVVVPSGGVADEVHVLRGPSCDDKQGPTLIAPNAAR